MTLIDSKAYPDSETYRGIAQVGTIQFSSPRTGLEPMEFIADAVIRIVETIVPANGATLLDVYVYAEPKTRYYVPYYEWTIKMYMYTPEALAIPETLFVVPAAIVSAVAVAIGAASLTILIWAIKTTVVDIVYGPPEIDPDTGKPTRKEKAAIIDILPVAAVLLLGYGSLKIYQEYIKTQKLKGSDTYKPKL